MEAARSNARATREDPQRAIRVEDGDAHREMLGMLLEAVRRDPERRQQVLEILQLEPVRRKIAINVLVTNMQRRGAPADFTEAWDALQEDRLAEQFLKLLSDSTLEARTHWIALGLVAALALVCGAVLLLLVL